MMVSRLYEGMEKHDTLTAVLEGPGKIGAAAIPVTSCDTMDIFGSDRFELPDFPVYSILSPVVAMAFTLFSSILEVPAAASILLRKHGKTTPAI